MTKFMGMRTVPRAVNLERTLLISLFASVLQQSVCQSQS